MIVDLFTVTMLLYSIPNWDDKKHRFRQLINNDLFETNPNQVCKSDRGKIDYVDGFFDIFESELSAVANDLKVEKFNLSSVWCVKYDKGDWHPPHNHSSSGYSGIIYLDYIEREHTPVVFVNPVNDPINDTTEFKIPNIAEGDMVIVPSCLLHFTYPNQSDNPRVIIGFDLKFK